MPTDLLQFSWHAVPYFPAALLIAGVGAWIYARERGNRVSRDFFTFTVLFAAWVFGKGLRLMLVDAETATVLSRFLRATLSLGVAPLLSFAFTVLHAWPERRRALRAHCAIGIAMALATVGTPWIIAGVWEAPWGFTPRQGPLGPLFALWIAVVIANVSVDAIGAWRSRRSFEQRQVRLFCAALAVLILSSTELLNSAGVPTYPIGAACVLAFTAICGHIAVRHGIANVTARFASLEIADVMRAGFLVLDRNGLIEFVNQPSARMLGVRRRHDLLGQPLSELLGEIGTPHNLAACARSPADGGCEVAYTPPRSAAPRHLALSVSLMHDPRGQPTAFVCLVRDVTEERRQRLGVVPPQPTLDEIELRQAVANRKLVVHYQPIVELKRGTVAGFEALVRWIHPRKGPLRPDAFLPAAEALGLLGGIDRFVLEQACTDLPRLRAETGVDTLYISINQSTAALSSPTLVGDVTELVARCGLVPRDIRLELLENTVMIDSVRDALRGLRDAGFGVCIDDFGTGHSALSRLHEAPVTGLKIDRLFVNEMLAGNGRKIIGSIVSLANTLDLSVIAEGVTSPEQVALLREMGCGYAQGFLYSPPIGIEETVSLLRRRLAARDRRAKVLEARAGIEPTYGDLQSPA